MYYEYSLAVSGKPTYVLIHGMGRSSHDWKEIASRLVAGGNGVLVMDLLGHGRTFVANQDAKGFGLNDQVSAVSQLISGLGIKNRIHLVGHSLGAMISYTLAADAKGRIDIEKVHLIAPYLERVDRSWRRHMIGRTLHDMADFLTLGTMWGMSEISVDMLAPAVLYNEYLKQIKDGSPENGIPPSLFYRATEVLVRFTSRLMRSAVSVADDSERVDPRIPFQVIFGDSDELIPTSTFTSITGSRLARERRVDTVRVRNGSHFLPTRDSNLVYEEITQ